MSSQTIPPFLRQAKFVLGAAATHQFPDDNLQEVAFAGRSNVGKSSSINAIAGHKKLARTSKTPGRTQQINFFELGSEGRLVDLPGYGFAQVPLAVKKEWQKVIRHYLTNRANLNLLVLLMDIRHPLTDLDKQIVQWASESRLTTQVLLTKADKFKFGKAKSVELKVKQQLKPYGDQFAVQLFSAHNGTGVSEMRGLLQQWSDL